MNEKDLRKVFCRGDVKVGVKLNPAIREKAKSKLEREADLFPARNGYGQIKYGKGYRGSLMRRENGRFTIEEMSALLFGQRRIRRNKWVEWMRASKKGPDSRRRRKSDGGTRI